MELSMNITTDLKIITKWRKAVLKSIKGLEKHKIYFLQWQGKRLPGHYFLQWVHLESRSEVSLTPTQKGETIPARKFVWFLPLQGTDIPSGVQFWHLDLHNRTPCCKKNSMNSYYALLSHTVRDTPLLFKKIDKYSWSTRYFSWYKEKKNFAHLVALNPAFQFDWLFIVI